MIQYYSAEKLNTHMTAIRSLTGEIMYLIEGEEKAVLVDTCLGVGHLRKFVETLTEKPITVILTHGHVDHALGAPEFDEVYMNPAAICRKLSAAIICDISAIYQNLSLRCSIHAAENIQNSRLAGPTRSYNDYKFTFGNLKTDLIDCTDFDFTHLVYFGNFIWRTFSFLPAHRSYSAL